MTNVDLPSRNAGDGLTLAGFRRERQGGAQFDIVVSSHGFKGCVAYALEAEELDSLISDLRRMYESCSGKAEMRLHYEESHVCFELNAIGHLAVYGVLIRAEEPAQRLEFAFRSDQSCLPAFIDKLAQSS